MRTLRTQARTYSVPLPVLLALIACLCVPLAAYSQAGNPSRRVISGTSLPPACTSSVLVRDWFFKTGSTPGLYVCILGAWQQVTTASAPSTGIGGSTGATDNRILRSDGAGGSTLQNSSVTLDDSGNFTTGDASTFTFGSTGTLSWLVGPVFTDGLSGFQARHDIQNLTTNRNIIWPDASITVAGTSNTATLTNKTFPLASNTLTGTKAAFDTALSDGDFAYLANGNNFTGNNISTVTSAMAWKFDQSTGATPIYTTYSLATTIKAYLGVAGANNDIIAGTTADDLFIRAVNGDILFSSDNGTSAVLKLNTSNGIELGSGGTPITKHLSATASLNYAQAGATTCETLTITVTGAVDGNVTDIGVTHALANHNTTATFAAWVSGADTVSVRRCVISADGSDPAAATVRAAVWQY